MVIVRECFCDCFLCWTLWLLSGSKMIDMPGLDTAEDQKQNGIENRRRIAHIPKNNRLKASDLLERDQPLLEQPSKRHVQPVIVSIPLNRNHASITPEEPPEKISKYDIFGTDSEDEDDEMVLNGHNKTMSTTLVTTNINMVMERSTQHTQNKRKSNTLIEDAKFKKSKNDVDQFDLSKVGDSSPPRNGHEAHNLSVQNISEDNKILNSLQTVENAMQRLDEQLKTMSVSSDIPYNEDLFSVLTFERGVLETCKKINEILSENTLRSTSITSNVENNVNNITESESNNLDINDHNVTSSQEFYDVMVTDINEKINNISDNCPVIEMPSSSTNDVSLRNSSSPPMTADELDDILNHGIDGDDNLEFLAPENITKTGKYKSPRDNIVCPTPSYENDDVISIYVPSQLSQEFNTEEINQNLRNVNENGDNNIQDDKDSKQNDGGSIKYLEINARDNLYHSSKNNDRLAENAFRSTSVTRNVEAIVNNIKDSKSNNNCAINDHNVTFSNELHNGFVSDLNEKVSDNYPNEAVENIPSSSTNEIVPLRNSTSPPMPADVLEDISNDGFDGDETLEAKKAKYPANITKNWKSKSPSNNIVCPTPSYENDDVISLYVPSQLSQEFGTEDLNQNPNETENRDNNIIQDDKDIKQNDEDSMKYLEINAFVKLSHSSSKIFRHTCAKYAKGNCRRQNCFRQHVWPDIKLVESLLKSASRQELIDEYNTAQKIYYSKSRYIMCFVKECIKRNDIRVLLEITFDVIRRKWFEGDIVGNVLNESITQLRKHKGTLSEFDYILTLTDKNINKVFYEELILAIIRSDYAEMTASEQVLKKLVDFVIQINFVIIIKIAKEILIKLTSAETFSECMAVIAINVFCKTNPSIFKMYEMNIFKGTLKKKYRNLYDIFCKKYLEIMKKKYAFNDTQG